MIKHTILWADDDTDDLELFHEVLLELTTEYELLKFYNGQQVLDYLKEPREQNYPSLIILDMNMPVLDGKQTLAVLKTEERYQSIPVVVFTTSDSDTDRIFCARFGTTMITKPPRYEPLKEVIKDLLFYCRH
jgi:CheY-like chemotaxis protein